MTSTVLGIPLRRNPNRLRKRKEPEPRPEPRPAPRPAERADSHFIFSPHEVSKLEDKAPAEEPKAEPASSISFDLCFYAQGRG